MDIQRGFRDKLEKYINSSAAFHVEMDTKGGAVYDYSCFGVDENNQLSDDRYMVFYNQPQSPQKELSYQEEKGGVTFTVALGKLPPSICKLVFTVSIDGAGTMQDIKSHTIKIKQDGSSAMELSLCGNDFEAEKAIIAIELYKKDVWKIAAVASGFRGGLSDLLRFYGGEEVPAEKPCTASAVAASKIALKKGEKIKIEKNTEAPVRIENGWTAKGKDYDLKALVRYRNGKQVYVGAANKDEVLKTREGAVKHSGDIKNPGGVESIELTWHPKIASVAVSSYSALENGSGSFCKHGVFVRIKNGSQTIEIAAADTSVNSFSYTLCFGEIIYGLTPGTFEVSALELYSQPHSERRIGYLKDRVRMDIGPRGMKKS